MAYAGIDTYGYPGAEKLRWLKEHSNLRWIGFYLKAPSHPDSTYMPHRAEIAALGWGVAPIYLGAQTTGPGSHNVTAAQGATDGADACARMREAGFERGRYVYLDLENGPPLQPAQRGYVTAWIDAVLAQGFAAGVYCSYLMAADVGALRPRAGVRIWAFHVKTTTPHNVDGPQFPTPPPADSKFADAFIWQRDDEARIVIPDHPDGPIIRMGVDLNVSSSPDPERAAGSRPVPQVAAASPPKPALAPPVAANQPSKETKPMTAQPAPAAAAAAPGGILTRAITVAERFADALIEFQTGKIPFIGSMVATPIEKGIHSAVAKIKGADMFRQLDAGVDGAAAQVIAGATTISTALGANPDTAEDEVIAWLSMNSMLPKGTTAQSLGLHA